jgi:hypothetical protein
MPGIPLNIGYGLGGLVQGFNQARSQGLQQAIQQFALQQAQRQQNAQGLAALALQAGLLNNQTNINPLQGASGSPAFSPQPSAATTPAASPAPTPNGGSAAPAPRPTPGTTTPAFSPGGFGDINLPLLQDPRYLTGMPTPEEAGGSATTGLPSAGSTGQPQLSPAPTDRGDTDTAAPPIPAPRAQAGTPASGVPIGTTVPPPPGSVPPQQNGDTTPTPTPTPSRTSDATPSRSGDTTPTSGGGGGGVQAVFPGGQTMDISSMFKTMDYGSLAKGIARLAPPGTSQADIYEAVVDLSKLSEGDKVQQQQAGALLRALVGGDFKLQNTQMTTTAAGERQAAAIAGRENVAGQQIAGRENVAGQQIQSREKITQMNIDARQKIADASNDLRRRGQDISNQNKQAELANQQQRIQISLQQAGRQDAALQISAVRAKISTIKAQLDGSYSDADQKTLKTYNEQIAAIAAKAAAQGPAGP